MHKYKNRWLAVLFLPVFLMILFPYLSPIMAGNLIFISLAAVPLFLLNGLIFFVMLWKRSRWSWLSGTLLLCSLPCMAHHVAVPCTVSSADNTGRSLHLISWNAEGFHLSRETLTEAANYINNQSPDLFCLQERPHTNLLAWDTLQTAFLHYPYKVINSREDEVLNLALFSKWPIMNMKEYYFTDSYNKILQADIQIKQQTIRLFNVHLQTTGISSSVPLKELLPTLQHNAIQRNRQADLLVEAIKESPFPVIVCGDFNDSPSSYAYQHISRLMQDCFLKAGCGWGGSYQPWGGFFRIDYTFCSSCFSVHRYQLTQNNWSDHKIQESEIYMNNYLE